MYKQINHELKSFGDYARWSKSSKRQQVEQEEFSENWQKWRENEKELKIKNVTGENDCRAEK